MTFPKKTELEIQVVISKYGYNIRSLIEVLHDGPRFLEDDTAERISHFGTLRLYDLIRDDQESAVCHTLTLGRCLEQPRPGTSAYANSDVLDSVVASHAVWKTLVSRRGRKVYTELANMLDLFRKVPEMAPSAGWLWESLCHDSIRIGGILPLREMVEEPGALVPLGRVVRLPLLQLAPEYFEAERTIERTCDLHKYYIPNHGNNPTFDAFFHHEHVGVGLQMTLGRTHTLNPNGLQVLHERLGILGEEREQWFVFVIRRGSTFRCTKPSATQTEKFRFFTLELESPNGEHHFPLLADVSVDGLGFAEVQFDDALEMDRSDRITGTRGY